MSVRFRILHVEDVVSDAELISRELKKSAFIFDHCIVDNEKDYADALSSFKPDIVLCDHSLPAFNSVEALRLLKETGNQIPFIIVTATMSEVVAAELVKLGADDYIFKDRLKRVSCAVENALEKYRFEKEHKQLISQVYEKEAQAKRSLAELSRKLQLATKAAQIGVWEYHINDGRLNGNEIALSLYGVKQGFITYMEWLYYVHPEDRSRLEAELAAAIHNDARFDTEFRIIRADHSVRVIKATGLVERDPFGKPVCMVGTNQDITEQRMAEQAVKASEAKYRAFYENSLDAILLTATDGRILAANAAACSVFQMTEEEVCRAGGARVLDTTDPGLALLLEERARTGKARGELTFKRKDGSAFPAEISSAIFTDASGEQRTSMIIRDISERKRLEEELKRKKKRYTDLFLQAPSAVGVFRGATHVFELANPEFVKLTGKKELVGKPIREALPELEGQGIYEQLDEVYKTGQPFTGKEAFIQINKNGAAGLEDVYLNFIYQPYRDSTGAVKGIFFFANDVTEQVEARKKIEESEKRYKELFYGAPSPQYIFDAESLQIVMVNDAALRLYGYNREEFSTMTVLDLRSENDKQAFKDDFEQFKRSPDPFTLTTKHLTKSGSKRSVEVSAVRVLHNGKCSVLTTINDMTEQLLLQQKITKLEVEGQKTITRAQIRAQEQERQFIGEELHDNINQQLATVKLYLDLAYDREPMRLELVKKSEDLVNHAINEIRSLCRALVPSVLKDMGLTEALTQLLDSYKVVQKFAVHFVPHACLCRIEEDLKISLFRIIQEQLNNISKYAEAQNVWIQFSYKNGQIKLTIRDDGKGFDLNAKKKGIGLVNMKNRLALYNGTFSVASTPGMGCEIKIAVPLDYNGEKRINGRIDILIAEDDLDDQQMIKEAFEARGQQWNICFAKNGNELIAILKKTPGAKLPSLIVLDYYMPGMNAPETIRHLEANRAFQKIPKIIYSAAQKQENDGLQGLASYIKKGATCSAVSKNVQQMLSYAKLLNDIDDNNESRISVKKTA